MLRLNDVTPVKEMKALGVRPMRGDFGIPEARIIQPGDPASSTLYFRMAKFGRDRMPHIGADLPDEAGLKIIGDWISELGKATSKTEATDIPVEQALARPATALGLARKIGRGECKPDERTRIVAAAEKLPPGPTRELFEGYFPQTGPRPLGHSPRPSRILSMKGDGARGEKLFWSQSINCSKCHKIGDKGGAVGPDLSSIGKLRSRDDLLQSLLEPSRRIEPKFAAFVVRTLDGKSC